MNRFGFQAIRGHGADGSIPISKAAAIPDRKANTSLSTGQSMRCCQPVIPKASISFPCYMTANSTS
jgi:hypothetical protein